MLKQLKMGLKRKNTQKWAKSELSQRDPSDLDGGSVSGPKFGQMVHGSDAIG